MFHPSRAHKLLPLLEGMTVINVKTMWDLVKLRRIINSRDNTLVMIDNFGIRSLVGVGISLLLNLPLAIRLRGDVFIEAKERYLLRHNILGWLQFRRTALATKLSFWRSQLIVFNSKYLLDAISPHLKEKYLTVVYNPFTELSKKKAADNLAFSLPSEGFHILSVTNMNLTSKVAPLIRAIDEWMSIDLYEKLDIYWVILGDGSYKDYISKIVDERGLKKRILILGSVADMTRYYHWSNVLVHLTKLDAFPNTTMESMMFKKAVITNSDSCGTREQIFHNKNGLIISNSQEFIEALKTYARNPKLRNQHGQAGKQLVLDKFSINRQRTNMLNTIENFFRTFDKK